MKDYNRPRCERCIYRNHCPCGYSNSNAACLTLYTPQTREMLLECIRDCNYTELPQESITHAIDEIRDYVNGFFFYLTEPRMRASATEPCSEHQQACMADCMEALQSKDQTAFLRGLYQILDNHGSKQTELTYPEFLLLNALLMTYDQSFAKKGI